MPRRAFTLIELLIVVAIIAILAAIAIPNFQEAQIRSKVSRTMADFRTIKTGLMAYLTDNNKYPETDWGTTLDQRGAGLLRLTTPVAYLTTIPRTPFNEQHLGDPAVPMHARNQNTAYYRRAVVSGAKPPAVEVDANGNGLDDAFELARKTYVYVGFNARAKDPARQAGGAGASEFKTHSQGDLEKGDWYLKSVGPDSMDDDYDLGGAGRLYDPRNGTNTIGDIVVFIDSPHHQAFIRDAKDHNR